MKSYEIEDKIVDLIKDNLHKFRLTTDYHWACGDIEIIDMSYRDKVQISVGDTWVQLYDRNCAIILDLLQNIDEDEDTYIYSDEYKCFVALKEELRRN